VIEFEVTGNTLLGRTWAATWNTIRIIFGGLFGALF
jgi:hypothetical protein